MFNTGNIGVGVGEDFFEPVCTTPIQTVNKPRVEDFLKRFESALSFDISMTGTGITEWHRDTGEILHHTIEIDDEVDLSKDDLAEEKMRLAYEKDVLSIYEGKHFEVVVIENAFGGKNFDTVRKLLALNSVIGTLILRGKMSATHFYKRSNKVWKKYLSKVHRVKGLKDKLNIEEALLYLEYPYAVNYTHLSKADKERVHYQDILDSLGQLVGLAIELNENEGKAKTTKRLQMRDICVSYMNDIAELDFTDDKILTESQVEIVELDMDIEKKVLTQTQEGYNLQETTAYAMYVPNDKLGTFASRYDIPFNDQGYVYVVFYDKQLKKRIKEANQNEPNAT